MLDLRLNQIHQLNATATHVWDRCDGRHDVKDIAAQLVGRFEVDEATATSDAAALLEQFSRAGLLQDHLPNADALSAVRVQED